MMFLRYENFRSYLQLYPITTIILAVNLIVFLLDFLVLDRRLTIWGAFYQEPVLDRYGLSEPYRYLSSIILHAGWDHLLFNCFSTLVFAPPLERMLGHLRYLLFYLAAGVAGNALSAAIHAGTEYGSVGASGAIYGVFGAYLFLAVFRKNDLDEATRKTIYGTLAFGLIYSVLSPAINVWAHVGGGAAGFAMMGVFLILRSKRGSALVERRDD
ncbi:rhomboid family intramembrane serine protease [Cohnella cholangitidis]|uniref:Rhomboid family intramembrane serine protease n=1 Tax=Cohnella cholangitidis TaxID=2598458 RepID=A0A7G5BSG1_9BACL|nr:rhomboid family intramembrane serine protease [Cohnella cholangitidis]QMV39895.1 rhomboid family intramembrane serine protease [Cohnella cholangitidis]